MPALFRCQENNAKLARKSRQTAKWPDFRSQIAGNSAEAARFDNQRANANTQAPMGGKRLLPAAAKSPLATRFSASGRPSVDFWHRQNAWVFTRLDRDRSRRRQREPGSDAFFFGNASALDRLVEAELCSATDRLHIRNGKKQIVIRNSQLLLSLILSLLLIGVGLIGNGKRTGLATM